MIMAQISVCHIDSDERDILLEIINSVDSGLRILPFVDAMGRQFCAYFVCNNRRILLLSSNFGEV